MSGARAIVRDLRDLPAPRPLEIALEELARLRAGEGLVLVLVHEPHPLLALLPDRGIAWRCRVVAPGEARVACWREGDDEGRRRALAELP